MNVRSGATPMSTPADTPAGATPAADPAPDGRLRLSPVVAPSLHAGKAFA